MPRQSIVNLRQAIESAPEMTPEHRAEMLALVASLEREVASAGDGGDLAEDSERAENLRGAIEGAGEVLLQRAVREGEDAAPDFAERISDLEKKVEMVAVEHPVIASVLTAIARLV